MHGVNRTKKFGKSGLKPETQIYQTCKVTTVSITDIKVKPLALPSKTVHLVKVFFENFAVNLIEITASDGTVGLGECTGPGSNGTLIF